MKSQKSKYIHRPQISTLCSHCLPCKGKFDIIYRYTLVLIFTLCTLHLLANPVFAAKKRMKGRLPVSVGYSTVGLRSDRRAINVNFINLGNVKQVNYSLIYTANGIEQGVGGTIAPSGEPSAQRELLFATCSKGICTYHYNITNMRFIVTTTLPSGLTSTKSYRIKP